MKTVLILGATGLFGGHLARQLLECGRYDVICAGRSEAKLAAFTTANGGRFVAFDRAHPESALNSTKPFVVVDAAGPFQDYGNQPYGFARACLTAGAHYLDIADAPDFVQNISSLDTIAKASSLCAISGASTTPALSSAVVAELSTDLDSLIQIETTILPGNKTPRGLSVMRAILGQIGQPMPLWEHNTWNKAIGWSRLTKVGLKVGTTELPRRPASLINTPDALLAAHFKARTVLPRAGLELGLFHHTLRLARFLVQTGLVKSLAPLSRPAHRVAGWFEGMGSSVGGMRVAVIGTQNNRHIKREWDLIANDGHGPKIPVQPAALLIDHLSDGKIPSGARPCIGELELHELEAAMARFGARSEIRTTQI